MTRKLLGRAVSLATMATLVAGLAGCGGGNANVVDPKAANAEKKIDDDPLSLLPSAAMVLVNVDARAVFASGSSGGQLGKMTEKFVPIGEEGGFIASRDLDRVIVGVYSMQGADVAAVLVGKFDEQKIQAAAQSKATPSKGGGVIVASQYGGRTLYTVNNAGFTVLSARTVLVGTETGIRRAIDRIKDGRVTRDQPPWMIEAIETKGAAFAAAADFANQPIGAASVGGFKIGFVQGMKAVRVVGNFHDPGINIAGTITYPDAPRAEAAAGELRTSAGLIALIPLLPQLKNLEIKPVQTDAQVAFALDDTQLRQFLQTAQQYMGPQ